MPTHMDNENPPPGTKVRWEVQVPGNCIWTVYVDCLTKEEAYAQARARLEADTSIEPDNEPEPEYSDAEIVGWEDIEGNEVLGDPLPNNPEAA